MNLLPCLILLVLLGMASCAGHGVTGSAHSKSDLSGYIDARTAESHLIPADRQAVLRDLSASIAAQAEGEEVALTFICTHNSRRSQMAQIWAKVAADRVGWNSVATYSGGTEATAFHPHAVAAMRRAGFLIDADGTDGNPRYTVSGWGGVTPLACFSKRYDDPTNPAEQYLAVMTCSDADRACPIVSGASARIPVTYEDPKAFDGTAQEAQAYDERCAQIAREMLFVFQELDR